MLWSSIEHDFGQSFQAPRHLQSIASLARKPETFRVQSACTRQLTLVDRQLGERSKCHLDPVSIGMRAVEGQTFLEGSTAPTGFVLTSVDSDDSQGVQRIASNAHVTD